MFTNLGVKTDFSILKSLIKIEDLINYAKNYNLSELAILDNNLNSSRTFYLACKKNNIKPIIGLDLLVDNYRIFLYPKNYNGLTNLFKLTKYIIDNVISINDLKNYNKDIIAVLPVESYFIYDSINKIFDTTFLSFKNVNEEKEAKIITDMVVYINDIYALDAKQSKYVNYLNMIDSNKKLGDLELIDYSNNVLTKLNYDTSVLTNLINIEFKTSGVYIPHYDNSIKDSFKYLSDLAYKGLNKRCNNNIPDVYQNRLDYELSIINKMGFTDYFLIVFDYVRYAIKNDIYVGAGRGSAAGSLVAYALGITMIDPLKYNLLFERFLNPERITMPDIDVDFEDERKDEVVEYVKNKYGINKVAHIITYGTMTAKEVLRSVGKINNVDELQINNFLKQIDSKKSLKDNLTSDVKNILSHNSILKKVYDEAFYLEGIKHHIGTHAAGVVISSIDLDNLIPIVKSGNEYLTGYQMMELEDLGLIKMDFLSIKNLTILSNTLKLADYKDNINNINLEEKKVYDLFSSGDTVGIFQFESTGMTNFLKKQKPKCFKDLVMAIAMFRPGPMDSIDEYLKRKNENKKIEYIDPRLEPILKDTYGILIYQEQIMEILKVLGGFTYSEADVIRRAISKKKLDIIESSKDKFINNAINNGITSENANKVFELIMKFADFGFNKSHSVAYAFIAYQMAYLKCFYPECYYINLLNSNIGGELKTATYIDSAKKLGISILKPDVNYSSIDYTLENGSIRLPLRVIKGIGTHIVDNISINKPYDDFYDFINKNKISKNTLITLIDADVFSSFNINHETLKNNLDACFTYADLIKDLDSSLVNKPEMVYYPECDDITLTNKEKELYGFYISNHPASKYPDVFKQINIRDNFNKLIETVVIIDRINVITTKNNKDMAFITASDETTSNEFVLFDKPDFKVGDLLNIKGRVERRNDKFQIVINTYKKI